MESDRAIPAKPILHMLLATSSSSHLLHFPSSSEFRYNYSILLLLHLSVLRVPGFDIHFYGLTFYHQIHHSTTTTVTPSCYRDTYTYRLPIHSCRHGIAIPLELTCPYRFTFVKLHLHGYLADELALPLDDAQHTIVIGEELERGDGDPFLGLAVRVRPGPGLGVIVGHTAWSIDRLAHRNRGGGVQGGRRYRVVAIETVSRGICQCDGVFTITARVIRKRLIDDIA